MKIGIALEIPKPPPPPPPLADLVDPSVLAMSMVLYRLETASTAVLDLRSTVSKESTTGFLLSMLDCSILGELFEGTHCAGQDLSWMHDDHDDEREEHWGGIECVLVCFVVPEFLGELTFEITGELEETIDDTDLATVSFVPGD